MPPFLRVQPDGVLLSIKLQPRAARNEITGEIGAELKIRVTAPPVDSAANQALLDLLVGRLQCPRGSVRLVKGQTSRHKTVLILGMPVETVAQRLAPSA
jgi:hypothetical protein